MDRHPISQEGYDKLREEIRQLEDIEMPKIAEKIGEARAEGDLSENAEYHGQREAQGLLPSPVPIIAATRMNAPKARRKVSLANAP